MAIEIPLGYCLVPEYLYKKFLKKIEWEDIVEPTINDVHNYLGISVEKIKKDLRNIDCPLRQTYKGGKGRGNEKKFYKESVDKYKIWLTKNKALQEKDISS